MPHPVQTALLLVAVSSGLAFGQAPGSTSSAEPPAIIAVSARADVTIPADRATIRIAVETRGQTAAVAGAANARIQQNVLAALRAAGVDPARIATAGYTVAMNFRPEGPDRTPQQDGYIARNAVHVQLSALDRVGAVIDTALAAGANRIDGVQFTATQTDSARRSALEQAIATARQDAATMARAAGGSLGRLLELSTEFPSRSPYASQGFAGGVMRALETDITPREVHVAASVVARWEFQPSPP